VKILGLSVNNVLAIKAVEINPTANTVTLGGRNGAGKSSVLNSIAMALGGSKLVPEQPIHQGADRGSIRLDLGEYVVERVFTSGGERLEVKSKEGAKYPKPQAMLDKLYASIAFDPLQFATEKDAGKQAGMLRQLLGLDFSDLDARKAETAAKRTDVNRDHKAATVLLAGLPPHNPEAPAEPVSVSDIAAELTAAQAEIARQEKLRAGARKLDQEAVQACERETAAKRTISELEQRLALAREELVTCQTAFAAANERSARGAAAIAALVAPNTDAIMTRLQSVESTNKAVEANGKRAATLSKAEALKATSEGLTAQLELIETERATRIASAPFPVEGLGFSESGVTYQGLPFRQASSAEQLRVSVAVAVAMNPRLRVCLVRDGSLLDDSNLATLHSLATEHDCQLWIEDARTQDPAAIIIEDGEIKAVAEAAQ
jgi:energy-coupling factor transporter ATP-binding protein EcfA2